jgi:hypothetical protein
MDRLERFLEEFSMTFAKGMAELKSSQEKIMLDIKSSQDRTDEQILALKASQEMTDKQLRATDAKLERIGKQLADQGFVQGETAEELFYRNVKGLFGPFDLPLGRVRRNVKVKGKGEFDIVADGDRQVLVIEVKSKLSCRMVDDFMEKKLPRFKALLPEYRDRQILAGVGALVMKDEVGRYAEDLGLFVLTQSSDGGATLFNRKGFKPKEFK